MRFTDLYLLFLGFSFHSVICRYKMLLSKCNLLIYRILIATYINNSNKITTKMFEDSLL